MDKTIKILYLVSASFLIVAFMGAALIISENGFYPITVTNDEKFNYDSICGGHTQKEIESCELLHEKLDTIIRLLEDEK